MSSGSRFTPQNQTTHERLSTNTVGLVALSDFRKRRAQVLEQQEREAREAARLAAAEASNESEGGGGDSAGNEGAAGEYGAEVGAGTETGAGAGTDSAVGTAAGTAAGTGGGGGGGGNSTAGTGSEGDGPVIKAQKKSKKGGSGKSKGKGGSKLSFAALDDEDEDEAEDEKETGDTAAGPVVLKKRKGGAGLAVTAPAALKPAKVASPGDPGTDDPVPPPRLFTKQALRRQATEREALRKEFLARQAAVKATEIAIPFVFYEGANIPGGVVRVKKGDFVWVCLDRSRKVGARLGVGDKRLSKARLHWARIGVDDLMLVRGTLIIPHHYDFYFFIINKTFGPGGTRVFDFSDEPPAGSSGTTTTTTTAAAAAAATTAEDDYSMLEGAHDDPSLTKVVDRRWYERNKHIYPANLWQEFDPEQDYTHQVRRDQGGNAFFFAPK